MAWPLLPFFLALALATSGRLAQAFQSESLLWDADYGVLATAFPGEARSTAPPLTPLRTTASINRPILLNGSHAVHCRSFGCPHGRDDAAHAPVPTRQCLALPPRRLPAAPSECLPAHGRLHHLHALRHRAGIHDIPKCHGANQHQGQCARTTCTSMHACMHACPCVGRTSIHADMPMLGMSTFCFKLRAGTQTRLENKLYRLKLSKASL